MIEANGLTKVFGRNGSEVRALDGLDLSVRQGRFIVVAGANGSGKSTLLGAIAGTVRPNRGSIRIDDTDGGVRRPEIDAQDRAR